MQSSCAYCYEFDRTSNPVPLDHMRARIDKFAELGTGIITLSDGEPLLHPERRRIDDGRVAAPEAAPAVLLARANGEPVDGGAAVAFPLP